MLTRRVVGLLFAALGLTVLPARAQAGRDIQFFSEGVVCHGRMFVPSGFSAASKAAGRRARPWCRRHGLDHRVVTPRAWPRRASWRW